MSRKFISAENRREVIRRAGGLCEYCRTNSRFSETPFDVEHITPESAGGESDLSNLALACHGCNLFKSNKTNLFDSATDKIVRLFNPRVDVWDEHFVWTSDFGEIVGRTAIGRATVEALNLNREGLVNKRKVMREFGEHPPEDFS